MLKHFLLSELKIPGTSRLCTLHEPDIAHLGNFKNFDQEDGGYFVHPFPLNVSWDVLVFPSLIAMANHKHEQVLNLQFKH